MTDTQNLPDRPPAGDPLQEQIAGVLAANYELEREIGRGGMGVVYLARDRRLKRLVAVKLLPPDLAYRPDIRSRFLREAETSAALNHPNIVPIFTVEEADNLVFFIMGYVHGDTLARRLRDRGPMPPDEARRLLREVGDALAYAHSRGVVHRDIKPDNILLDNDTGRTMVTDFGIARAVSETTDTRLTTTGLAIGTPAYMSPEQCAGDRDLDGRSDLYSLGVVAYQMLSGDLPFAASNTPAMFVKHISEQPRPIAERCAVPPDLAAVVMRLLAKDPNERFADARAMVQALDGTAPAFGAPSGGAYPFQTAPVGAATASRASAALAPAPQYPPVARSMEMARWEAEPVRRYRRKLVTWGAGSVGLVLFGLFADHGFFMIDGIWGVFTAVGYAKLWNKGYDWRDVLRQPRDTLFADVVNETIDDAKSFFDPAKREVARERLRARLREERALSAPVSPAYVGGSAVASPARASVSTVTGFDVPVAPEMASRFPVVQEAAAARAEIHRLMANVPKSDRDMLPDVTASADSLFARIEQLAANADELERADVPGMDSAIEREIGELENEANPLDEERSERRVRRLAQLRRQRISLRDLRRRREEAAQRLARCVSAMQSMRMDLSRLVSGSRSYDSVTQVTQMAERAMQLGREVDAVLYAQDEIARVVGR